MKVREQQITYQVNVPTKILPKSDLVTVEIDETMQGAVEIKKRRIILKVPDWDLPRVMKQYEKKNPKIID